MKHTIQLFTLFAPSLARLGLAGLASCLALQVQAQAQAAPATHTAPGGHHAGHFQKQWDTADLDKDGQLSKAEAQVAGMKHLIENFEAIDANKDGKVSPAELRAFMDKNRPAHARDKKGHAEGKKEHADSAKGAPREGAPGFKSPDERRLAMEERFKKMDTNGDGALSKAEVQAGGNPRLLEHFDVIDANKDGKITQEEIRNAWQKRGFAPR